jgi:pimeloyl-ACP methyl ester carboxylesterase
MTRHLVNINGHYWHYRQAGNGPVVMLLHASPRNSAMFVPLMELLSQRFTVIAPDTPGYGMTDSLSVVPQSVADYLPHFRAFFRAVTNSKFSIYGTATGAQLGIGYAYTYPDDVVQLFLDNAAHFDDEERNEILASYFPDLSPQPDGSHLTQVWQMASQFFSFFPWFKNTEAHRVSTYTPTVEMINTAAMEFLQAGPHYDAAYRAAFEHEKAENIAKVSVPTTLFRWKGAMLLQYIDGLIERGLPANVVVVETEAAIAARYEGIYQRMIEVLE